MNYFTGADLARRYARSRPNFHPLVVDKIKVVFELREPLHRALDTGCGTGHSAIALTAIADRVIGADRSADMLRAAARDPRVRYVAAAAEELPFRDGEFDLVAAGLGIHWFERDRFLREANRVLGTERWLAIYNDFFQGKMRENPVFERWHREDYLARYPSPPRDRRPLSEEEAERTGFRFLRSEPFAHEVEFSRRGLADYLLTQTNAIAAVGSGTETLEETAAWIDARLEELFPTRRATFEFGGQILYLQKLERCA
jgi:SAM-dependent methyltransferase